MSAIRAVLKTVALEKTRREIETWLKLQLQIPMLDLLDTDRTFIHRKHLTTEIAKFINKMAKVYQNIYLEELEEMYVKSPHSIILRKIYIPNTIKCNHIEGIPFRYILIWYDINQRDKTIGFRGFPNYQEAEEFLYYLIAEDKISIDEIFFIEDVDIVLDIDAILEQQLEKENMKEESL